MMIDTFKESPSPLAVQNTKESTGSPANKVLIAEDNPDLRSIFSRIFAWHKFEIVLARDGVEAVEMLHEDQPDLVVMDVNMPRMTGLQVLQYIRSQPELKDIKVIVVTGNCTTAYSPEAAYADLFLVKPIAIGDLVNFTKRLLSSKTNLSVQG